MSDTSPYGVTQHADAAMVTANELVGERISPVTVNAIIGSAAGFSTAPYVPPKPVDPVARLDAAHTEHMCIAPVASKGGALCHASKVRGTDFCVFHTKGQLIPREVPE